MLLEATTCRASPAGVFASQSEIRKLQEDSVMIRTSTTRAMVLAALTVGAGALGINCSSSNKAGSDVGQVTLALSLPSGATVSSVHWSIASTSVATVEQGNINTSDPNATASVFTNYPASTGDTVTLTATTSAGVMCSGSNAMPFTVTAGQVAMVGVTLTCGGGSVTQNQGSVDVNGTFVEGDTCPLLTSWIASPLQVSAHGGQITVGGMATDSTPGDSITYLWSASPSGSFLAPTSNNTTYVCDASGAQTLTL